MKQTIKSFLCLTAILICIAGCNNHDNNNENELLKDEHAIVDTIVVPQASDFSFDDALAALNDNNMTEAAMLIGRTAMELSAERENMNIPEVKQKMDKTIHQIQIMADSLVLGKAINVDALKQYFSKAELLLARNYYLLIETPEAVDKTYVAMDKTVNLMEAGILHGDNVVKHNAGTIVQETKNILQKAGANKSLYKEDLKKHSGKIKDFLAKHTQ